MTNLATTATYGATKTLPYSEHFGLNGADVTSHIGLWNTDQLMTSVGNLPIKLLRYAGGTSANTWRWRRSSGDTDFGGYTEGGARNPDGSPVVLTLARFKQVCAAAGATPVFDLNFACDSTNYGWTPTWAPKNPTTNLYDPPNLSDQMALLAAAASLGIPIKYVELGNEFPSFNDGSVKQNYAFPPEGKSTTNPATGVAYASTEIPPGYVYDRSAPVTSNINGEDETQLMLGKASTLPGTAYPARSDAAGAAGGGYLYGVRAGIWTAAIKSVYPSAKVLIHAGGPPSSGLGPYNKKWWARGLIAGLPTSGTGKPDILVQHPYHDGNNAYTYGAPNTPPSIDSTQPGFSQAVVDNYLGSPDSKWQQQLATVMAADPGADNTRQVYWYSVKSLLDAGMTVWNTEYGLLDTVGLNGNTNGSSGVDGGTGGWGHLISNLTATLIRYNDPHVTGMTLHSLAGNSAATAAIDSSATGLTSQTATATIGGSAVSFPLFRFAGQHYPGSGPATTPYNRTANGHLTAIVSAATAGATTVKPMTFSGSPKINDTGATGDGLLGATFAQPGTLRALLTNLRSAPVDVTVPSELVGAHYVLHTATSLAAPIISPASIASAVGTVTTTVTLPAYSVLRVDTTRTSTAMVADLNEPPASAPGDPTQVQLATYQNLLDQISGLADASDGKYMPISTGAQVVYPTFSATGSVTVKTGVSRWYVQEGWTIIGVRASAGTAPAGSPLIVDVKKNGTSIFTTTSNRASIPAASNTAVSGTPDITSLVAGDYLTVDVLQIGSSTSGSDLTVQVELMRTS